MGWANFLKRGKEGKEKARGMKKRKLFSWSVKDAFSPSSFTLSWVELWKEEEMGDVMTGGAKKVHFWSPHCSGLKVRKEERRDGTFRQKWEVRWKEIRRTSFLLFSAL